MSVAPAAWPWPRPLLGLAAAAAAAAVCVLDRLQVHAGLTMLVVMVASVGLVHGAMDAMLLTHHIQRRAVRAAIFGLYLLATVAVGTLLQPHPGLALMLLLGLSMWHFGEAFGTFRHLPAVQRVWLRAVRGGAPVLMPALLARAELEPLIARATGAYSALAATVWAGWSTLSAAWLCLAAAWCVWAWLRPAPCRKAARHTLLEIGALALLYTLVSPLMGFALYFGLYHAGGHIQRVLALAPTSTGRAWWREPKLVQTFALTLALGALLVVAMAAQSASVALPDLALHTVIVALAAISVPHVLLIGWWAGRLPAD